MRLTEKALRSIIESLVLKEVSRSDGSLSGMLGVLSSYADNTWIFFDTETTGLRPEKEGVGPQLTQIAAVAAKPSWISSDDEPTILGTFNEKISFTDYTKQLMTNPTSSERLAWDQKDKALGSRSLGDPRKLLSMTSYGKSNVRYRDEQVVIDDFLAFITKFNNPILIAQNASFDMKFLNVRSGGKMPRFPVLDTLTLIQQYLFPAVKSSADSGDPEAISLLQRFKNKGRLSASMGTIAKAYDIETSGWHDALEDVKMLMSMYRFVLKTLETQRSKGFNAKKQIGAALLAAHKKKRSQ